VETLAVPASGDPLVAVRARGVAPRLAVATSQQAALPQAATPSLDVVVAAVADAEDVEAEVMASVVVELVVLEATAQVLRLALRPLAVTRRLGLRSRRKMAATATTITRARTTMMCPGV